MIVADAVADAVDVTTLLGMRGRRGRGAVQQDEDGGYAAEIEHGFNLKSKSFSVCGQVVGLFVTGCVKPARAFSVRMKVAAG